MSIGGVPEKSLTSCEQLILKTAVGRFTGVNRADGENRWRDITNWKPALRLGEGRELGPTRQLPPPRIPNRQVPSQMIGSQGDEWVRANGSQFVLHEHLSPPDCSRLAEITRAGDQELQMGSRPQASAQIVPQIVQPPMVSCRLVAAEVVSRRTIRRVSDAAAVVVAELSGPRVVLPAK